MDTLRSASHSSAPGCRTTCVVTHCKPMALRAPCVLRNLFSRSLRKSVTLAYQSNPQEFSSWSPPQMPAIQTMPYDHSMQNKIAVTGVLGTDMRSISTPLGLVAQVSLFHLTKKGQSSDRFTVELYAPLGQQALEQLRDGMTIHVKGSFRCESFKDDQGNNRSNFVIETSELFVPLLEGAAPVQQQQPYQQAQVAFSPPAMATQGLPQQQWQPDVVMGQQAWQPNVPQPQAPASPPQQQQPVQQMQYSSQQAAPAGGRQPFARLTPEEEAKLWQELERNPAGFWDNSLSKSNPKAPDYKHKTTGQALWLSSRNAPQWAQERAAPNLSG